MAARTKSKLVEVITNPQVRQDRLEEFTGREIQRYREAFEAEYGFDSDEVLDQLADPGFSFLKMRESIRKQVYREAVSEQMFGALIRGGVAKIGLDWYQLVNTVYKQIAFINPSTSFEEWYAPVYRGDIPIALLPGEEAPEGRIQGFQWTIRNLRYSNAMRIERELIEDDKTGVIIQRAQQLGEGMAYAEEQAAIISLFAASAQSRTPDSNVAGSTTEITTTYGQISQPNLENAWSALTYVEDLEGNFMLVSPDGLVVDTKDQLTTEKLMESMFQPSFPTGTAGTIGYFQTKNVLAGKFTIHGTPFVTKARAGLNSSYSPWALMQKNKGGLVFQPRTPLSVEQEAPNSGLSLRAYSYFYVAQRRFGVDVVEPRFVFWGN
jgi:hypothetical protein